MTYIICAILASFLFALVIAVYVFIRYYTSDYLSNLADDKKARKFFREESIREQKEKYKMCLAEETAHNSAQRAQKEMNTMNTETKNTETEETEKTREEQKAAYKAEFAKNADVMVAGLEALVEVADENPQIVEGLGKMICKYFEIFKPVSQDATKFVIQGRIEALEKFRSMGLSDELAVKLVVGR